MKKRKNERTDEMENIRKKQEKGITLIALVVTIVVLLILAGVSIAMLSGENGIITNAQKAKEETKKSEATEELKLALNAMYMDYYLNDISGTYRDYILDNPSEIERNLGNGETVTVDKTAGTIKYKGYTFVVGEDGLIKIIDGIAINKGSITLQIVDGVGETETLTETISPDNASNKKVTWSSDKTSIAKVDESGKITAKALGNTEIIISTTDGSNISKEMKVTVVDEGIVLNEDTEYKITEEDNITYIENIKLQKENNRIKKLTKKEFISNFKVFNAKIYEKDEKDGETEVVDDNSVIKTGMIVKAGDIK